MISQSLTLQKWTFPLLLILFFLTSFTSFAQVSSQEKDVSNRVIDKIILENSSLLIDLDESEVLDQYNSFDVKEISFQEYLRFAKLNTIQNAKQHKGHTHDEIPSKTIDCTHLSFENGAIAPGWTGGTGTYGNAFSNVNIASNGLNAGLMDPLARHTIMSIPPTQNDPSLGVIVGYDPVALDSVTGLAFIPFLPPGGGAYSARLGNQQAGSQKEKLSMTFDVTASETLFHYQYAILISGAHTPFSEPYFSVTVKDSNGITLPAPFASYYTTGPLPTSPPVYVSTGTGWYGMPWQNVNFNLSGYIGQSITLEFEVADCGLGGHATYAYVNAGCGISGNYSAQQCYDGTSSFLIGPTGLTNYQWYGPNNPNSVLPGATLPDLTIYNPNDGDSYYLTFIDSVSGQTLFQTVQITTDSLSNSGNATVTFCAGNPDALLIGASGKTNYQWFDGNVLAISGATTQNHLISNPVVGDTFYLRFDEDGCPKWQSVIVIAQPHEITQIDATGSCPGSSDGNVLVTVNSPATSLLYTLNPGSLIDFNGDFQNLSPGTYQLNIIDNNGNTCITSIDSFVVVPAFFQVEAGTGDTLTICKNDPFDLFQALTGATNLTGSWSGQSASDIVNGYMPQYVINSAGTYQYTYLMTDSICPSDSTVIVVQVLNNCSFGLEEFFNLENVIISPNPSIEMFSITFGETNIPESYSITDIIGKEIKSGRINEKQNELSLDFSKEAAGEYYIHFYRNNEILGTKKVMKIN